MKLIFLDADGTLLMSDGTIPQRAKEACRLAQSQGHKICLCTGRQKPEITKELQSIQYDGIVAGAGSYVEADHKILKERGLRNEQRKQLYNYFSKRPIPTIYEATEAIVADARVKPVFDQLIETHCSHLSKEAYEKHGLIQLKKIWKTGDPKKISFNKITFLSSEVGFSQIYADLSKDFEVIPSTFAPFGKDSGEVAAYGITKAMGMRDLMDYFGVAQEDVIAIGDGANDLNMFEVAGQSVAMGNASQAVKEKADIVTADIDKDGIYQVFSLFNLLG